MRVVGLCRALVILMAASLMVGSLACAKRKERRAAERALLTDEDLYFRGLEELSRHKLRTAREYLERIKFSSESLTVLRPVVRLVLADIAFYRGDDLSLIEAHSKYLDFVTFHGDHPMAPYAQFQAGICSLKQVRHPSRDQVETRVSIADLKEVIRRYPASHYAQAARDMIDVAESYLAEHDFLVGKFYLRRKVAPAASERFRRALDKYPRYRQREKLYFYLGQALLRDEKNAEASAYWDRLVADYPESEFAEEARKFLANFPRHKKGGSKE